MKDYKRKVVHKDVSYYKQKFKKWAWGKYLNFFPRKYQHRIAYATVIVFLIVTIMWVGVGYFKMGKDFIMTYLINHDRDVSKSVINTPNANAEDFTEGTKTNFTNLDNLENIGNMNILSNNPVVVSLKEGVLGNIIFYNKFFSSLSRASYSFVPLSGKKLNLVLQYDSLFRLIIGENNFKTLSLETNENFPNVPGKWRKVEDLERGKTQRFIGGSGFATGSPVSVDIYLQPDNQFLNLNIIISYFPLESNLGSVSQNAQFSYKLPLNINPEGVRGKYGIGLIESTDATVQLNELMVKDLKK